MKDKGQEQNPAWFMKDYDSFVALVSDHFNGGAGDTATLYDVEKFLRAYFKPMQARIKQLEEQLEEYRRLSSKEDQGWVSFKDKLPDDYQRVLAFDKRDGHINIVYYVPSQSKIPDYDTHWQPLPPRPESEQI